MALASIAMRCQGHGRAYPEYAQVRGKAKTPALVATMRKILHAICGISQGGTTNPSTATNSNLRPSLRGSSALK